MFILLLLLLVGESSLEDEFSFTKMYCSQVMSCCYGPGSDFQVAYETYPQGERSTKSVIMQLTGKRQKPIGIEIHYYSLCFLEHDDTVGACLEFYYGEHFPKKLYIQTVIGSHEATESRLNHLIDGVRLHESDKYFQILWLTQLEFQNDEDQFSLKKLHRLQLKKGRGKYLPNRTILASDVESTICKDPFQLDNHGQRSFDCSIQLVLLYFTMGLSLRFLFISI